MIRTITYNHDQSQPNCIKRVLKLIKFVKKTVMINTLKTTALLLFVATSFQSKAQLYIHSNSAYGFNLAPMGISANYSPNKIESVKSSFGKGLDVGIGAGYNFNKNLAAEINFTYLMGAKVEFTDAMNPYTPPETEQLTGRMYRIIPTLKFSAGEKKIKPYSKIGCVIGLGTTLTDKSIRYNNIWGGAIDKIEETSVFSGGMSIGLKGNIGLDIDFTSKLGVFAEINFISQAWAPKKMETISYKINGEDKLATLDQRDKVTEFVDSYDPNVNIEPYQNNKSLKIYLPYSSWGANIGVRFTLGKTE